MIFAEKGTREKKENAHPMKKEANSGERFCGNCRYHNTYEYPDYVFCFVRFQKRENPVVSTLQNGCDHWESKLQECFCLDDTLKKHEKTTK